MALASAKGKLLGVIGDEVNIQLTHFISSFVVYLTMYLKIIVFVSLVT